MRPSKSKPAHGVVVRRYDVRDQRGETCALGDVTVMFKCRERTAA